MKKKTIIALATLLAFGQGAWADGNESIGGIEWNKGKGYYEIDSADDLNDLAVYVNGEGTYSTGGDEETTAHDCEGLTFMVTQAITFTAPVAAEPSNFTPIGIVEYDNNDTPIYDKCFKGVFDGNGKTISGVIVYNPSGEAIALFGNVGYPGIIKNVILANSRFTGNFCVGGIVGEYTTSGNEKEHGIFDCEVGYNVIVTAVTVVDDGDALHGRYAGGIVGMAGVTTVSGCVSAAVVLGDEYIGGITGQIYKDTESTYGTLSDCYYTGNSVSGTEGALYVGNIVGLNGTEDDYDNYVSGSNITLAITLLNNDSEATIKNVTRLSLYDGQKVDVTLSGRTLYKDNSWNTICLPFDAELTGDFAEAEIRTLSSATFESNTLTLTFTPATGDGAVSSIEAGKPYIIKWTSGSDFTPTFTSVTVSSAAPTDVEGTAANFHGIYTPYSTGAEDNSMLYLGASSTLYYPYTAMTIGAFRAYFQLADGITAADPANTIRAFVLNFGDDSEASGIENVQSSMANGQSASWYDMLGRKLNGKPTATGMYINNGKKVAIK